MQNQINKCYRWEERERERERERESMCMQNQIKKCYRWEERERQRERERERGVKLQGNPKNVNRFNVEKSIENI